MIKSPLKLKSFLDTTIQVYLSKKIHQNTGRLKEPTSAAF